MRGSIHCKIIDGGWVLLSIESINDDDFTDILNRIKFNLHVITWDNKYKKYKTSVYELERLSQMCEKLGLILYATPAVIKADRRLVYLRKRYKKLRKRKKVELKIPLWTDNPEAQLYTEQVWAVDLMVEQRRGLLGDDMGLGKTPQAIGIILQSWNLYDYSDALIVVPTRLKKQWKQEILFFTKLRSNQVEIIGERFCRTGEREYFIARAHICKECKFFKVCKFDADVQKESAADYRDLQIKRSRVLIAGYESVRIHHKTFIKHPFDVIIFDEATKLKNHRSELSKMTLKFVHSLAHGTVIIPMSGTFIENRIEELFSIIQIVDPRVLGGWDNFKVQYLITDFRGNVVGYRNENQLKKKLDSLLVRRTIDEVWKDRPPLTESIIECPMGKDQAKVYADARLAKLKEIKDMQKARKINMANIAPLINYLLQIASTVKSIDPETKIKKHSSKIDTLVEMIEDEFPRKCKIVIFSHYANNVVPHIVEALTKMDLGGVAKIVGGVSEKAQERIIKRFKSNDDLRFLICSDAMAYGANLQFCNYLVNFDLPWNPAVLDQRIRRVYRRGQKKPVTIINFIVPGTIEEHLYQVLEQKRKLFRIFLKESVVTKGGRKSINIQEMIRNI